MYRTIMAGRSFDNNNTKTTYQGVSNGFDSFSESMTHGINSPLAKLLLQMIVIILVSRIFGALFREIHQPSVIGEVIAGICLGPSLCGLIFPSFSSFLFPIDSLGHLQVLSQLGLVLFMFVVGMELDLGILRSGAGKALGISIAGIIFPFMLGMVLSYFLFREYGNARSGFLPFSLFIGVAMSITAFPVLARIIKERKLGLTRIGNLAIACAAFGDITGWCILAAVISIAKAGSMVGAIFPLFMAIFYIILMFLVVKPFLERISQDKNMLAIMFCVLLASAAFTELIGVHALFGAFIAGALAPSKKIFRLALIEKTEYVSVTLLLPLFFAFSGLRTQIGLLSSSHSWLIFLLILIAAIVGKLGGTFIASRLVGENSKDSLVLGALLNTRGLMELVVLNIGYDLGIISQQIFTALVLMALLTTCMTGPILNWLLRPGHE
jgi:Kef-type K+ transport system membrane component KefB